MRIGVDAVVLREPTMGIPRVVRETLQALQRIDRENDYYLYSKFDFDFRLSNPRWHKCIHSRIPYLIGSLYLDQGIRQADGQGSLDVFWGTRCHTFPIGLARATARVLTVHDLVWRLYPETMERVNHFAVKLFAERGIRQAHKIISVSESTRQGLMEILGTPGGKIEVVHHGVSTGFTPRGREGSARFIAEKYAASPDYICTVGSVEPRKNLITLIEAVKMLHERGHLRHQMLIAGGSGWKNSQIYASVQAFGLTEREVKFLGRVPDEDLALLYSGAALFVFPSLYEGFGLPLIEAMSCGAPVIASNTSSIPEVVQDAGILVSPRRAEEFADAIARVTSDGALGSRLADKGLKRAREFTWETAASKVLRILQDTGAAIARSAPGHKRSAESPEFKCQ
jgi:glycosyltransferase involved in cell wall biosynthesis